MNADKMIRDKLREYAMAEFGNDFHASIIALETIGNPKRFEGPVYIAVVSLQPIEEDVAATLAGKDADEAEQLKRFLADGDEVVCIFDRDGCEIERHFRGMDYFFDYKKLLLEV